MVAPEVKLIVAEAAKKAAEKLRRKNSGRTSRYPGDDRWAREKKGDAKKAAVGRRALFWVGSA